MTTQHIETLIVGAARRVWPAEITSHGSVGSS